jgi:F420-dependent oxidoreductase-like protein
VEQVVEAEEDGFDSFWFGQTMGADATTVAALAGPRTKSIKIGVAVVPTYSRHPVAMAQQALTAQAATGGRFTLGVGPSHKPLIEGMWGLSYDRPAAHVREYLSVLRGLVQDGQVSFNGETYRVTASLQMPRGEPCSILLAALAPMMLRIAGELSDGTVTWMAGLRAVETHIVPRISAAAEAAGRPPPRVCVGLPVAVVDDAGDARERAARLFQMYGHLPNYRRALDVEGAGGPEDVAIIGGEREVEEKLRGLASAGATDFLAVMFPATEDGRASITRTREFLRGLTGSV